MPTLRPPTEGSERRRAAGLKATGERWFGGHTMAIRGRWNVASRVSDVLVPHSSDQSAELHAPDRGMKERRVQIHQVVLITTNSNDVDLFVPTQFAERAPNAPN